MNKLLLFAIPGVALIIFGILIVVRRSEPRPVKPTPDHIEPAPKIKPIPPPEPVKPVVPKTADPVPPPVEEPELSEKDLEYYHQVRGTVMNRGRNIMTIMGQLKNEPKTYKEAMKHMAFTDPSPQCRSFGMKILSEYEDAGLESFFRNQLNNEKDWRPQINAFLGLEKIAKVSPKDIQVLQSRLATETDTKAQRVIRETLEKRE